MGVVEGARPAMAGWGGRLQCASALFSYFGLSYNAYWGATEGTALGRSGCMNKENSLGQPDVRGFSWR